MWVKTLIWTTSLLWSIQVIFLSLVIILIDNATADSSREINWKYPASLLTEEQTVNHKCPKTSNNSKVTAIEWWFLLTFVLCAVHVNHHLVNFLLLNHRHILVRWGEMIHISITTRRKTFLNFIQTKSGNCFLTWPTSAGAIVEFMWFTACETPVTERLVWFLFHNSLGKADNKDHIFSKPCHPYFIKTHKQWSMHRDK